MHKDEAEQLVTNLSALFEQTAKSITTAQAREADRVRKDLDDIDERLNALERQRNNFSKYINDMGKALKETMNETVDVIVNFETNRKAELARLLEEVTGETYHGQKPTVVRLPAREEN